MKIAIILLFLGCTFCQRANRPPPTTTTTTDDDDDDDYIVSLVKSYIDAGRMRNGDYRKVLTLFEIDGVFNTPPQP